MMKRLILIFTAVLLTASAQAGDSLSVSLLTCSPGNDPASAFGHSGIRVTDHATGRDLVFNYGTYSFQEPHFLLKFLRGDLDYCLSINYFKNFKQSYERAGRGIVEQPMNLCRTTAPPVSATSSTEESSHSGTRSPERLIGTS